eukprot:1842576-Rhodomonas_salina.2
MTAGGLADMDSILVQKQLWEAAKTGSVQGIATAVSKGADVDFAYSDEGDAKALQCAALSGNTDAVAKLVELGANVNGQDKYKWTALHDAALNGHTATCAKLVELGADINAKTDVEDDAPGAGERTPLNNAAMNGHTETVVKLVELGAVLSGGVEAVLRGAAVLRVAQARLTTTETETHTTMLTTSAKQ